MKNILAFIQRLFSPAGQANVKAAYAELVLLIGMVAALIASFKAKDFATIFQQVPEFWGALALLIVDIRNIISSNEKGIADPALLKVTGVVNG